MDSTKNQATPVVTKETKNRISVDYEGKLSFKERMMHKLKASNTWIKVAISIFRFLIMLGVCFVIVYPFIAMVAGSFMSKEDIIDSTISLIPKHPSLLIYSEIITENHYFEALLNTLLLSLSCALVQTLISCLVGYGLAKFKFKGNKLLMGIVVLTMIIPHNALKESFVKHFISFDLGTVLAWDMKGIIEILSPKGESLMLLNTFWPLVIISICGIAFKNGLYIYLMRQFFKGVPDELEESAYVDGSGFFRTFFQIILPLAVPMMITVFLFSFSWQWTDDFYTGMFFRGTEYTKVWLMPDVCLLPSTLNYQYAGTPLWTSVVQNTGGLMIIAPLLVLYLFCQRYLVQGIERSGLVG
ncbi:MAG: carbohydrate ABC transporter permease [Clostridia bacterium]|nr:carbohydrate ABC transporter permease [Clostridia bacterium]MBR3680955.1 carbohydrate ABC transporter permease [Clostridia bacterium]